MLEESSNSVQLDEKTLTKIQDTIIKPLEERVNLRDKRDTYIYLKLKKKKNATFYHKFLVAYKRWNNIS